MQPTNIHIKDRWPADDAARQQYSLRKFGSQFCDLDVDFYNTQQPRLATQIVSSCLLHHDQPIAESEVCTWSLKKRLQALLAVTTKTRDEEMLLQVRCPQNRCGEEVELALGLNRFKQDTEDEQFTFNIGNRMITARLPNGIDQQQWMQSQTQSTTDLAKRLIMRVGDAQPRAEWQFPEEWLPVFSKVLEQQDELMTMQISSNCPACDAALEIAVDLEAQLLSILSQTQRNLLREVHRIALVYHWSEREIVELSASRRGFYLQQLSQLAEGALLQ